MFRCDHPSGVTVPPVKTLNRRGGYFARGNATLGTGGTIIDAEWLNGLQEEMCNIVLLDGRTLDKGNRTQLATVIRDLGGLGGAPPGDGGDGLFEPPDDGVLYSRYNPGPTPTVPPGAWGPALQEPRADGVAYARVRSPGQAVGSWVTATGRRRLCSEER
jgi:hypothetical protein